MASFNDIDMNGVEPQDDFAPIPAGDYIAAITASEIKQTNDLTGKYIKLEVTILEGKFKGRKIWPMLQLWNRNKQAVDIAKRELASIKIATDQPNANDSSAFHNRPVIVSVGIKPAKDGYEAGNSIRGWKPLVKAQAAPVQQAQPAPTGTKPWETQAPAVNHDIF